MNDIQNRKDLALLMQNFYDKLLADPSISYLFTEVAKIDIKAHLPILVDFWEMVLFQKDTYRKNVMQLHLNLNKQSPFTKEHFATWLGYFNATVDEMFEGEKAFMAKERAKSIATMMQIKMAQVQ